MENPNNNTNFYNSSCANGYGYYANPFTPKDPIVNADARKLTRLSLLAGAGIIGFTFVQYLLSFLLVRFNLYNLYTSNFSFQMVFDVMVSALCVFVPFGIIYLVYDKKDRQVCLQFDAPISKKGFGLAVCAGLMICCLGDFITSGFAGFVSSFGIEFAQYDSRSPSTAVEFVLFVIQCAVVPALVEEFAVRGVIMQPLRKYGDKFAIVMSALIFAVMHGNMNQIPFAFVAGLALGYFAISTGSVWTSVAIHFANNLLSVIINVINDNTSYGVIAYYFLMTAVILAGSICLKAFTKTKHKGFNFTLAPRSEKQILLAAIAVFIFISFVYSSYVVTRTSVYVLTLAVLVICFARYNKANRLALNTPPSSSLSQKMKISLYLGTPTVVFSVFILALLTIQSITITSYSGYFFSYASTLLILALILWAVFNVISSKGLEEKKAYKVSLVVIAVLIFFVMLYMMFSKIYSGLLVF